MNIAYVNSLCVRHDAISNAIRAEIGWLRAAGHAARLFAFACDDAEIPFTRVDGPGEVALDPWFQGSDLVVFHFGVHHALFDLLPVVPNRTRRLVVFHNVTPKEFVSPAAHDLIDRSMRQVTNMTWAELVVCVSSSNLRMLREANVRTPAVVVPLAMEAPVARKPAAKPSAADGIFRIAFVGRFVRSKGPVDLLKALAAWATRDETTTIRLDMIGNLAFSDPAIHARVVACAADIEAAFGARVRVELHPDATDAMKDDVLSAADLFALPTYHEGFCVPIVEALAQDCDVVSYDNSNLPGITGGLATLVPTGDVDAFSHAIEVHARSALAPAAFAARAARRKQVAAHLDQFSARRVRKQFLRIVESPSCKSDRRGAAA